MQRILTRLSIWFGGMGRKAVCQSQSEDIQVLVPEAVELPLPRRPHEEISVPASINGRDLSSGRL